MLIFSNLALSLNLYLDALNYQVELSRHGKASASLFTVKKVVPVNPVSFIFQLSQALPSAALMFPISQVINIHVSKIISDSIYYEHPQEHPFSG
jgi:hypothetical protein